LITAGTYEPGNTGWYFGAWRWFTSHDTGWTRSHADCPDSAFNWNGNRGRLPLGNTPSP